MKKLLGCLLTLILLFPASVLAIPSLGVAPGAPGDPGLADAFFDGFQMPLEGGPLTIWYGSNSGEPTFTDQNDIWLFVWIMACSFIQQEISLGIYLLLIPTDHKFICCEWPKQKSRQDIKRKIKIRMIYFRPILLFILFGRP